VSIRVQAGKLRHRIWVDDLVTPPEVDSDGARVDQWVPVFDRMVSAEVKAISGREYIAAAAVQSKVTTRIKVRFRPEYRARMRVRHRDATYNIEAVIPDPDSGIRFLTLLCSSGVNDG
jgi:SPP1 family predicted phage head-tail adaptor